MIKENKLLLGDCLDKLKELDDNSIDSIVSDPPYGLAFMGKKWDYDVPSQAIWEECMRVLKPGGHLLSFAGSRTYHRMAVRIEDAGFEIRDQIMWVYGSGFPKSHNIGKAVDALEKTGKSNPKAMREVRMGNDYEPTGQTDYKKGRMFSSDIDNDTTQQTINNEWEGWGTALKPAHEPIVMARKPFKGTVADNVLEYGTGAINIDDCRVGTDDTRGKASMTAMGQNSGWNAHNNKEVVAGSECGRFPANIIFDEEAGKILDEQSGTSKSTDAIRKNNQAQHTGVENGATCYGKYNSLDTSGYNDKGGASRFFYCPKTSKRDREEGMNGLVKKANVFMSPDSRMDKDQYERTSPGMERFKTEPKSNFHPTVKPTDLMQYLIRLVTKKGGVVLDPFMGSGSTGKAAIKEGMIFVGIEREAEYFEIAKQRIENEIHKNEPKHHFW